jgi:hypothetical protein
VDLLQLFRTNLPAILPDMELVFRLNLSRSDGQLPGADPGLNVLLAYEDAPVGNLALRILSQIAGGIDAPSRLCCAVWRFDSLAEPMVMDLAISGAGAADVILVAVRTCSELPESIRSWLEGSLPGRRNSPVALGVILDPVLSAEDKESICRQLKRIAGQSGWDFFASGVPSLISGDNSTTISRALTGGRRPCSRSARPVAGWGRRTFRGLKACHTRRRGDVRDYFGGQPSPNCQPEPPNWPWWRA